ncbi:MULTISPECIES: mechanosensitive ion channel family protein [Silvimonas]|uniref:mechanosensitive ion channel family protein n=1 Tax=Silvimonas TaxID=300264 RepID=UPI0024B3A25B|nr:MULTISPECIES: mechanosensitive ion channel domain-containing protein [Silvimonas]MDR3426567.1 mechanosensitive ion channel [Silvimonas sp.]
MRRLIQCLALMLLVMNVPTWAANPISIVEHSASAPMASAPEPADFRYMNRTIVQFRDDLAGATPAVRAQRAQAVLESLKESDLDLPLNRIQVLFGNIQVTVFQLGDRLLFSLLPNDQNPGDRRPFEAFATDTESNLKTVLAVRKEGMHWPNLIHGIVATLLAVAVLAMAVWGLGRLRKILLRWCERLQKRHDEAEATTGFDWLGASVQLAHRLIQICSAFALLTLLYVWLVFVLKQFVLTQPLGDRMGGFLVDLLTRIAEGFVSAVPGVITVVVILLITRAVQDIIARVFEAVQKGRMEIPGLHPDTAGATRRMVSVMVWALGLTFAYPYIPGSQSDVFKGLSVLFGFMITLGSAGIVNQLMSGMVLIYSRALTKGDLVAIGETTGVVTELSTLSVKLLTLRKEEITIPNAVVVGNTIHNYTRAAGATGSLLSTTVTIGYDTPWRQVHAMLEAAAQKTPGLAATPAPYVLQRALSDFYVEYQLFAHTPDPMGRAGTLSVLHANIQDEFNTWGVQIMSPHFEEQPHQAVLVPKGQWYPAPAKPANGEGTS